MKVSFNKQQFTNLYNKYKEPVKKGVKNTAKGVGCTALALGGGALAFLFAADAIIGVSYRNDSKQDPANEVGKEMMYIKENAPEKYTEYLEQVYRAPQIRKIGGNEAEYKFWRDAASYVAESLRVDSIAKATYEEGLQAAKKLHIK